MNQFTQRHYQALLGYLKQQLRSGALTGGSLLPPEAALAQELSFSLPSIQEGLHLLEMFGFLSPEPDGGYRISHDVSRGFTDLFTLMVLLGQMEYADVLRLRRSLELQSIEAVCRNITEAQKQAMYRCLMHMMVTPGTSYQEDEEFHNVMISASGDNLAISLSHALSQFTGPDGPILSATFRIDWEALIQLHVQLYQAIVTNQPERAAEAIRAHYDFILDSGMI